VPSSNDAKRENQALRVVNHQKVLHVIAIHLHHEQRKESYCREKYVPALLWRETNRCIASESNAGCSLSRRVQLYGMIPREAAKAITSACRVDRLDPARVRDGIARTSHPLMPLIVELSRVVGEPHGGWVHWGATTQNITQTGDVLILRKVHRVILALLGRIMTDLAGLAERSAEMVMAGCTHGQHAVSTIACPS
jgi:adenylosuccinate lyase